VADAIAGIKKFKSRAFLAKTDISMAYRNLPLRPEDYHLVGFFWNNLYYFDKCLPMGCSVSCQIFERFSSGLHWIGQYYMPEGLMFHILDDFLIVQKNFKFIWTSFYKFAMKLVFQWQLKKRWDLLHV
jgi:hypothetical protein